MSSVLVKKTAEFTFHGEKLNVLRQNEKFGEKNEYQW